MSTVATTVPVKERSKGRGYFWAGIGVCLFGIALCVAQYSLRQLIVPWYVAGLATLGVVLLWSVIQRPSVVRVIVLALIAALSWRTRIASWPRRWTLSIASPRRTAAPPPRRRPLW
jgi:uncharacterized membrane protein